LLAGLGLVTVVILACGEGGGGSSGGPTSPPPARPVITHTVTPPPSDLNALVALNPPGFTDADGLHIQLFGLDQAEQPYLAVGISCTPSLVLRDPAATYSASDLQAIHTYLNSVGQDNAGFPIPDSNAPPTLRWVSGNRPAHDGGQRCLASLQVTNAGTQPVQITQAGVVLASSPTSNSYQYALLDACTISPTFGDCTGGPAQTGECAYMATVQLAAGSSSTSYSAPITTNSQNDPKCPLPLLLQPGQTATIVVGLVAPASRDNLIFRVTPELMVYDTTSRTLVLPTLTSTLVYADAGQFSCYGLQGQTFTRETGDITGIASGRFCI
jgi:hypothetical protein